MSRRFATAAGAFIALTGLAALVFARGNRTTPLNNHQRRRLVRVSPSILYNEDLPPSRRALQDGTPDDGALPTSAPQVVEYWPTPYSATGVPTAAPLLQADIEEDTVAHDMAAVNGAPRSNTSTTKYAVTVVAVLLGFLAVLVVGVYLVRLHLMAHRTSGHKTDEGDTEDPSDTDFPSIIDIDRHMMDQGEYSDESDGPYGSLPVVSQHSLRSDVPVPLPRLKCPKLDRSKAPHSCHRSHRTRRDLHAPTMALSNADGENESPIVRQMKQAAAAFNGEASNALEL